jgi:hypothetical protein
MVVNIKEKQIIGIIVLCLINLICILFLLHLSTFDKLIEVTKICAFYFCYFITIWLIFKNVKTHSEFLKYALLIFYALSLIYSISIIRKYRIERRKFNIAKAECVKVAKSKFKSVEGIVDFEGYCECAIDKVNKMSDISFKEEEMLDVNGRFFNEVIATCFEASKTNVKSRTKELSNKEIDTIPLLSINGVHKVKLNFSDYEFYFVFDSGAALPVVSVSFIEKLKKLNVVDKIVYKKDAQNLKIANGEIVNCRIITLTKIRIGKFMVDSCDFAVLNTIENIDFLLGKSFINQFNEFTIQKENNILILKK